jgi:hypothetical protein
LGSGCRRAVVLAGGSPALARRGPAFEGQSAIETRFEIREPRSLNRAAVLSPVRNLGTRPSASLIEDGRLWTTRTLLPLNCPEPTLTRRLPDRRSRPFSATQPLRAGTALPGPIPDLARAGLLVGTGYFSHSSGQITAVSLVQRSGDNLAPVAESQNRCNLLRRAT